MFSQASAGSKEPKYFDWIAVAFVAVYLVSEITSTKLFALGRFHFPAAIVIFPISYIFGDILTEVYGFERTRRVIWMGFFSAIFMSVVLAVVQRLPAAPEWHNQEAFESTLGQVPRIVFASILAYWTGEFINSYVMARMKILTKGRHLWSRTIGSTVVGQAVDSVVFVAVAFGGMLSVGDLARIVIPFYAAKVLYEVAATPVTYFIVERLKRAEGLDVYDETTNFSPFKF